MAGFFDEFFDEDFYEPVAATDHEQRFGRLYTTHTYFPHQNACNTPAIYRPPQGPVGS